MQLYQPIQISGCITQECFIKGRTIPDIEKILGFNENILQSGVAVAALIELPRLNQFELLGYTQVTKDKFNKIAISGEQIEKIKEQVLSEAFTIFGRKRLVKVISLKSNDSLDPKHKYKVGLGAPQWDLGRNNLRAQIVAIINPGEVFK